ncbi:aldose 1-epimerase family protein [Plantibacter flavus]
MSGRRIDLAHGAYSASIASVGASLRSLRFDGRDLIVPFEADEVRPAFRGAMLAPWPNRVVDGRYTFGGEEHQLALTEPARGHALHGLAAWLDWEVVAADESSAALRVVIEAQAGYPYRVEVTATFTLDDTGLRTDVEAVNLGDTDAPYGTGPHPYLVAGAGRVDDWTLTLPAAEVLTVTPDRLIPVSLEAVDSEGQTHFDFRSARPIGDTFIDHAFSALSQEEGRTVVRLTSPSGTGVAMHWADGLPWVQVHTADQDDPERSRLGLAVEPMTCPPDAFSSGTDLVVLEPGTPHLVSWTISAL